MQARDKTLETECSVLQTEAAKAEKVKIEIKSLEHYVEDEKQIPVAEEQLKNAADRIKAIDIEVDELQKSIAEARLEYGNEILSSAKEADISRRLADAERSSLELKNEIEKYTLEIGSCRQTIEAQQKTKDAISRKRLQIKELASQSVILDNLKIAFSRDGIPNNIVKSVLPALTAMANGILGQMSAGNMSLQFKTEKLLKSNAAKEVETLEVLIEENGHALPYRSR